MKFSGLQFLLFGLCTGATAVVIPGPPVCQAPADYCYEVPVLSANACKALISRSGIAYASCTRAPATVVRTETSSPTTTTTRTIQAMTTVKTITTTTTIRGPSVSLPPTTLPSTVTSTQTVVSVSSTVTTTTTTTTATTTSFTSTTTTTTAVSDTQTPWTQEYCQVVTKRDLIVVLHEIFKRERWIKVDAYNEFVKHGDIAPEDEEEVKHDFHGAGKRADDSFPTSCSCFLTRTLLNAAPTTTTTTIIKQFTTTTTKIIGGTVPTKTNTFTISKTTSIPGTTIKAQTVYSTTTKTTTTTTWTKTTSTQTSITTFTTGTTSVSTSVSTSTSTRVATQYPCAAGQYGRSTYPGVPSSNKVTPFILTGTTGEESCCLACFKNQYCAFWAMPDDNSQCKLYISSDNSPECTTDQCLGGYPLLRVNQDDDGWNYHPGGCGNKYQVIQTTTE